jgi:hypothetical protein
MSHGPSRLRKLFKKRLVVITIYTPNTIKYLSSACPYFLAIATNRPTLSPTNVPSSLAYSVSIFITTTTSILTLSRLTLTYPQVLTVTIGTTYLSLTTMTSSTTCPPALPASTITFGTTCLSPTRYSHIEHNLPYRPVNIYLNINK